MWHDQWRWLDGKGDVIMMRQLADMGTEELILVIGDDERGACNSPDIVFTYPKKNPLQVITNLRSRRRIDYEDTWELMNAAAMKSLTDFQALRVKKRERLLLGKSEIRLTDGLVLIVARSWCERRVC